MDRTGEALATNANGTTTRILYVASDSEVVPPIRDALREVGITEVEVILDGRHALPAFRRAPPDVVLLDCVISGFDAASVAMQIGPRVGQDEFLPIVMLADSARAKSLRASIDEVVSVFFRDPSDATGIALLVSELAAVRGNGRTMVDSLARRLDGVNRLEAEAALHLARFAELKDHPGSGHVFRVGQLAADVASALGFEPAFVDLIRLAAPLHDVGKVGVPDEILLKEAPLTLDELDVVKQHTVLGASILAGSESPLFRLAEEIALFHHENWDGTGYIPGLESDAIPLVGRIVRVIDTFDALTRARPFADRWHRHHAVELIREQAGRTFDPQVVEAFLDVAVKAEPADDLARNII